MRKVFTFFATVLLTATLWAQSPEKMSYQAVVRDAANKLVINQAIGMQISILQGSVSGTEVYIETHSPTSNANGLVSVEIGSGTIVSGDFASIDWANGPYFIKTETDPTGGTNYTIIGTNQLVSVPYALHAKTAETVTNETDPLFVASPANGITSGDIINWNNKLDVEQDSSVTNEIQALSISNDTVYLSNGGFVKLPAAAADGSETKVTAGTNVTVTGSGTNASPYVVNVSCGGASNNFYLGQDTLGGIVFYIYLDQNGNQHGLIVSKTDTLAQWQSTTSTTNSTRSWDGAYNMGLMINSPAKTWVTGLGAGWYLPSIDELSILWQNRFHANKGLNGASATLLSNTAYYWSSTEYTATGAFSFNFYNGVAGSTNKTNTYSVRAVRAF
ncbi:MAG: DUF1566 domain-containing protein [Bacteroidales bacterium]|nr:DUF1566 domain-containing protein [Bacteroidales bacterium]